MVKRNKWSGFLIGLTVVGAVTWMPEKAFANTAAFADDFASYDYSAVDSARYTLYGDGRFQSNSGEMIISYGETAAEENGLFVNIKDLFAPGEKIKLSLKYSNGNWSTPAAASICFYHDRSKGTGFVFDRSSLRPEW